MLSRNEYVRLSLEINLFFQRIMKEHLFFIETSLPPAAANLMLDARRLKESFEELLHETVFYANGVISNETIKAEEIVTPYTLQAEEITARLTGAMINTAITESELALTGNDGEDNSCLFEVVNSINERAINLVSSTIALKREIIRDQRICDLFIFLYPLLMEHITREAVYFLETLEALQESRLPRRSLCDELNFWNTIMGEHAEFIDGLLDPTEKALKETAAKLADKFEQLVEGCKNTSEKRIVEESTKTTKQVQEYKTAATNGLIQCQIRSIIVPLLGPVAEKMGIDLIWFGVLLAVNMQTSFLHPPFGFALFFLRSVAPASVKTSDIYWGAIPFVCIQLIMVCLIIVFPQMVTIGLDKPVSVNVDTVEIVVPETNYDEEETATEESPSPDTEDEPEETQ
ncbi:MAG TPA: DUF2935 domain-containing protein [Bacillota bacterium]|nr:DUF2935 domain-containing protein [Bacillota bacterium]